MQIAITGGTGYIGKMLTKKLLERGHKVRCLSRKPPPNDLVEHFCYDFEFAFDERALVNIDAVIHLACYTKNDSQETSGLEISAAKSLQAAAIKKDIFFIYASSLASSPEAPTLYGKTKYCIEQNTLANGGTVIRPGLVYGGEEGGLYGTLCDFVRDLPLLPNFIPDLKLQPIYFDDLVQCIVNILEKKAVGMYNLASNEQISLTEFLKLLIKYKIKKRRLFLPVPWKLFLCVLMFFQKLFPIGFDPNRLLSLSKTPYIPTSADLETLGIVLKPLEESLMDEKAIFIQL